MTPDHERLRLAMPRIVSALHDLVGELDLTNDELLAALAFLSDVGRADEMILLSDVLGVSRLVDDQTHDSSNATASNVLGPFYRPEAPWIGNPGSIVRSPTNGTAVVVSGGVTGARSGDAIADAVVDVWQADADGAYSNEDAALDPWNLRGRLRTDAAGRFDIATIVPSHYTVKHDGPVGQLLDALGRHPWRPAHIHFRVDADGYRTLVTQAYIADGPYLDDDAINGVKPELVVAVRDGRLAFDMTLDAV